MSKVFRRPMFRKGGGANMNGIMSGIQDRQGYQDAGYATDFGFDVKPKEDFNFNFQLPEFNVPESRDIGAIRKGYEKELLAAAGDRTGYDPLTSFLLQYGPALGAAKPKGGFLATALGAAQKPLQSMLEEKKAEDKFLRDIRTQAAGAAIKAKEIEDSEIRKIERDLAISKANIENKIIEQKNAILQNKQLTEAQRNDLLTKLGADRQTKIEVEELRAANELKKIEALTKAEDVEKAELALENRAKFYSNQYPDSYIKAENHAKHDLNKIDTKIRDQFGVDRYGGVIEATSKSAKTYGKKKENIGKVYWDVVTGKGKRLRLGTDGKYIWEDVTITGVMDTSEGEGQPGPDDTPTSQAKDDKSFFEKITGTESKPFGEKEYKRSIEKGTEYITTPVSPESFDVSNLRRFR